MYIRTGLGTFRAIRERFSRFEFKVERPIPLIAEVKQQRTPAVEDAINRLGRCEDLRFSPGGTLIAIPGYRTRTCLVLSFRFDADSKVVSVEDFIEIESPAIPEPHGVDFLDDETLVIGPRSGSVAVLKLPRELGGRRIAAEPISLVQGKRFTQVAWPGSVAVARSDSGEVSILVCNNYIDRVSQHFVDPAANFRETQSKVLLARGLFIPDGITVSPDGGCVAVSSHGFHNVQLYPMAKAGRFTAPVATLAGSNFPHGLRFTPDGAHLLLADAGSPYLHIYERGAGWEGSRTPTRSVQVLDDETYRRGRSQPDEGGPKGVDIGAGGRIVAICCEFERLKFFSLNDVLGTGSN